MSSSSRKNSPEVASAQPFDLNDPSSISVGSSKVPAAVISHPFFADLKVKVTLSPLTLPLNMPPPTESSPQPPLSLPFLSPISRLSWLSPKVLSSNCPTQLPVKFGKGSFLSGSEETSGPSLASVASCAQAIPLIACP